MSINKLLFVCFITAIMTTSCAKEWFTSHHGNMPTAERIERLQVGMTKNEVSRMLGVPSNIVSFDNDTWIYMSSEIEQIAFLDEKELSRDVLVLKFDNNKISEIRKLTKEDGKKLAVDKDRTETTGNKVGFFEKYFGGVGAYTPLPVSGGPDM